MNLSVQNVRQATRLARIALGCGVLYTLVFSYVSLARHYNLHTQMNDLGNMTQAIHQAAQGNFSMPVSNDRDGRIRSRLGVHANYIFVLFAPVFKLCPQSEVLLILASMACGATGLGVFYFARLHLGEDRPCTLLPALAFWLSPIVHDANLFDFHVITVAAMCIVWMLWAFDSGHPRLGWLLAILALACKEDIPLMLFAVGFFYGSRPGTRRRGVLLMCISALWFLFTFLIVIPHLQGSQSLSTVVATRASWLGRDPLEIAHSLVTRPVEVFLHCADFEYSRLPYYLLLSGGMLALPSGRFLLAIVPPILLAILSGYPWMTRISGTYYWITSIAVIILGCVLSAKSEIPGQAAGRRDPGQSESIWRLASLFWITLFLSLVLSPSPYGLNSSASLLTWDGSPLRTLRTLGKIIPADASLSVQNSLGAHFATRSDIASYPLRSETADYLLFHLRLPTGPNPDYFPAAGPRMLFQMSPVRLVDSVERAAGSLEWKLILQENDFYLFERIPPGTEQATVAGRPAISVPTLTAKEWEPDRGRWFRFLAVGFLGFFAYQKIASWKT